MPTSSTYLLSIVVVVRDLQERVSAFARDLVAELLREASQYELIFVDNGSADGTLDELRSLTAIGGLPDVQVYALQRPVDNDVAAWAGVENSLGDYVAIIEPDPAAIALIARMLDVARSGTDVVFASNETPRPRRFVYATFERAFRRIFARLNGIDLQNEAPYSRLVNRRVVNYVLQFPLPVQRYRFLSASGGFSRRYMVYQGHVVAGSRTLMQGIDRGARLLATTTRAPLRLVTALCAFGAATNVLYTMYVIAIALFKQNVAPGWITLSLQQSGMFFLISLVLLVLGEYVVHVASLSSEGPAYLITNEFRSAASLRQHALNVEDASTASGESAL